MVVPNSFLSSSFPKLQNPYSSVSRIEKFYFRTEGMGEAAMLKPSIRRKDLTGFCWSAGFAAEPLAGFHCNCAGGGAGGAGLGLVFSLSRRRFTVGLG